MDSYIGRTLGNYRLIEQVGQGGMATVFKAYQPSMDRYVAVKVLPSHFTQDATFVARFTQEAHTLARLEHPHILPVYDYGEQDGITYLVMRYIEAGTLRDLITERGALDLRQISRIMGQVGSALSYAHDQGVVHRDIKPSNVLIDPAGNAFLTDFGIAKIMAGSANFTGTGAVIGTPAYMAPEQGMGKPLDHRCDIYALGVVLYEMVAGHVPFDAETPLAVMMMHAYNPLPLPRQTRKDLPEVIERIILKALAKSPEDRFQSAVEMVETLERATNGLPTGVSLPPIPGGPTAVYAPVPGMVPPPQVQPQVQSQPQTPSPEERPTVVDDQAPRGPEAAIPETPSPEKRLPMSVGAVLAKLRTFPWILVAVLVVSVPLVIAAIVWGGSIFGDGDGNGSGSPGGGDILSTALLIDNRDPAFAVDSGDWDSCNNGDCGGMSYGEDFRYAGPGCLECRASFHFSIAETGLYDVSTWWPRGDDRATDTPFTLAYGGTSTTIVVDQRRYGGGWYLLATLPLTAGMRLDVSVAGTASGYANADAVQLAPAEGWRDFVNHNAFRALASQGDDVWAGGPAGLVRWNLETSSYEIFTNENGLPSDQVYDVLVNDAEDCLWVATDDGVARFEDGQWTVFDDRDGLDSSNILALFEDDEGGLWATTMYGERGLNYYDGQRWGEPPVPALPVDLPRPLAITVDDDLGLFVGLEYDGLARYADGEWTLSKDALDISSVYAVTLADDDVYIGFDYGAARLSLVNPGEIEVFSQLEDSTIFSIYYAGDDTLWFGGDGLYHYDPEDGTWDDFSEDDCPALAWQVHDIVEIDGVLMFVTEGGGLWAYENATWHSWEVPAILGSGAAYSVVRSGDGALWFSYSDGEVIRYHSERGERQEFAFPDSFGFDNYLGVDGEGRVWRGTYGALHFYDGQRWQTLEADAIADGTVFGVAFDSEGVMWVSGFSFLSRYDPRDDVWTRFTAVDHPALDMINNVFVAADDTLWVAGEGGLAHYDGETWRTVEPEGFTDTEVDAVSGAPDGNLWFVINGDLHHWSGGVWESFDWQYHYATDLRVAPDGIVWVWGGDGIGRYDPEHYTWDTLAMEDGLVSNDVTALRITPEGVLWIGTGLGVSRYVP